MSNELAYRWEERAAILEYSAGRSRVEAERLATLMTRAPVSTPCGEAALRYARQGLCVFPAHNVEGDGRCSCRRANCGSIGKHPRTANGSKAATTDEAQIRDWWSRWPDANVAIATGEASGVWVLDVDVSDKKRGDESLLDLVAQIGALEFVAHTITGGGGDHYYFHYSSPVKNGTNVLGPGLDIRGDGGYVLAPPSNHILGAYAWAEGGPVGSANQSH